MGTPPGAMRPLYEQRAAEQYAAPVPLPDPRLDRKFARICELVAAELPRASFLDAGCGDGRYLAALAAMPWRPERLAGVDLSSRILETARATAERAGVRPLLRQGSLEALPFADGEFDLVLCSQVLEHVLDAPAAAGELARVLAPGGALLLSTDNRRNVVTRALNLPRAALVRLLRLRGRRGRIHSPATPYTPEALRTLLEEAGFAVERVETFRFHLMWPFDLAPLVRALNALEARLPPHGVGDIVVAVARRPQEGLAR